MKALTCPVCKGRVEVNGAMAMVCPRCANALVVAGVRLRLMTVLEFVGLMAPAQAALRRAIAKAIKAARPAEVED